MRGPGIAGTIEAGQEPLDIVQVTDMFTTAASIAGVKNQIPNDRVTDGGNSIFRLIQRTSNWRV